MAIEIGTLHQENKRLGFKNEESEYALKIITQKMNANLYAKACEYKNKTSEHLNDTTNLKLNRLLNFENEKHNASDHKYDRVDKENFD